MGSVSIPMIGAYVAAGAEAAGSAVAAASPYLAAAGAVAGAVATHQAGVAAKNEDTMKARQAGLDAGGKQIEIRQNMLKALASQNAAAGAAGIGTGGSFGANVNRQISQNQNDLLTNSTNAQEQQSLFAMQGNSAETTANLGAGASLLDAGAALGKAVAPPKPAGS
jgi:hypothetical protein